MHQNWVQDTQVHALLPAILQGVTLVVCFKKNRREATKEPGHRQIHFPVSEVNRRIDQHSLFFAAKQDITFPQIAMKQGRTFVGKKLTRLPQQVLNLMHHFF